MDQIQTSSISGGLFDREIAVKMFTATPDDACQVRAWGRKWEQLTWLQLATR